MISQGLVILYFPILFDVLTKQDDTGENTLNFDFFHLTCYSCGSLIFFFFLPFPEMVFCTITLIVTPLHEADPHGLPMALLLLGIF